MSVIGEVLRLSPKVESLGMLNLHDDWQGWNEHLTDYLDRPNESEIGSVLLVPTYRLEEVEEVIEPEKPGVPVEPYVGMVWHNGYGQRRVVVGVGPDHYEVLQERAHTPHVWDHGTVKIYDLNWDNYPHTPSTPAVTRKVKKWVKITDSPEC